MFPKINIAIDGYSSCGKGTLAKQLAQHFEYVFIDSGSMYRAVTLYLLNHQVDVELNEAVHPLLEQIELDFKYNSINKRYEIHLNGENVEPFIRDLKVSSKVSMVAKNSDVRRKLVEMQKKMGISKGVVMDGRDIGTVVFPDAELKIFMTASVEVRAQRRFDEMNKMGEAVIYEDILQNLTQRDFIDSSRDDSPLTLTNDYRVLDNSKLSQAEQFEIAKTWVEEIVLIEGKP